MCYAVTWTALTKSTYHVHQYLLDTGTLSIDTQHVASYALMRPTWNNYYEVALIETSLCNPFYSWGIYPLSFTRLLDVFAITLATCPGTLCTRRPRESGTETDRRSHFNRTHCFCMQWFCTINVGVILANTIVCFNQAFCAEILSFLLALPLPKVQWNPF